MPVKGLKCRLKAGIASLGYILASKRLKYTKAVTITATHFSIISYTQSAEILCKDGLEID
jgi:hypothetical protein